MPKNETRNILLNNLGSKRSLVMKFGQYMQYYKIIFFIKKFYEKEPSVKKILWSSAC